MQNIQEMQNIQGMQNMGQNLQSHKENLNLDLRSLNRKDLPRPLTKHGGERQYPVEEWLLKQRNLPNLQMLSLPRRPRSQQTQGLTLPSQT